MPTPDKPRSELAEPPSPALRGLEESAGESEATIERALYIGNYSAAVDACIKVALCSSTAYMLLVCCCDCLHEGAVL